MKKILFIWRYIKYFFIAKNKHSAQSPFLYQFITEVLNKNSNDKNLKKIDQLRNKLYKSKKVIEIKDFGAGSQINKSKKRKIRDIAYNSAKNAKFGKLLYRIIKFYNTKNILELGTSLGISTLYLAKADDKNLVYTSEGCTETAKIAEENFKKTKTKNINITLGNFEETLKEILVKMSTLNLAFIDGNHTKNATIAYFEECLKYSKNDTIFVFDDIHWSKGMEKAWECIKSHKKTTLTIDLFYVGIVFIKSELSKENHIIRF